MVLAPSSGSAAGQMLDGTLEFEPQPNIWKFGHGKIAESSIFATTPHQACDGVDTR
jgi:hypothetical protein